MNGQRQDGPASFGQSLRVLSEMDSDNFMEVTMLNIHEFGKCCY